MTNHPSTIPSPTKDDAHGVSVGLSRLHDLHVMLVDDLRDLFRGTLPPHAIKRVRAISSELRRLGPIDPSSRCLAGEVAMGPKGPAYPPCLEGTEGLSPKILETVRICEAESVHLLGALLDTPAYIGNVTVMTQVAQIEIPHAFPFRH